MLDYLSTDIHSLSADLRQTFQDPLPYIFHIACLFCLKGPEATFLTFV